MTSSSVPQPALRGRLGASGPVQRTWRRIISPALDALSPSLHRISAPVLDAFGQAVYEARAADADEQRPATMILTDSGLAEVPDTGPLASARRARNATQFNAALGHLMRDAAKSYGDIHRFDGGHNFSKSTVQRIVTGDKLPTTEGQVHSFALACDASKAEAELWVKVWSDLKAGKYNGPALRTFGWNGTPGDPVTREYTFRMTPGLETLLSDLTNFGADFCFALAGSLVVDQVIRRVGQISPKWSDRAQVLDRASSYVQVPLLAAGLIFRQSQRERRRGERTIASVIFRTGEIFLENNLNRLHPEGRSYASVNSDVLENARTDS